MLILLIRKEAIYNRIIQNVDTHYIAPFMPDLTVLHMWIADNSRPTAALLDPTWPNVDEAEQLLRRLGVPITQFNGQFAQAEEWISVNLSRLQPVFENSMETEEEPVKIENETHSDETTDEQVESAAEVSEASGNDSRQEKSSTPTRPAFSRKVMENHENPLLKRRQRLSLSEVAQPKQIPVVRPPEPPVESEKEPEAEVAVTQVPEAAAPPVPHVEPTPAPALAPTPTIIERIVEKEVEKPVYIREERHVTLRANLLAVVGIWPRTGVSTIAQTLAYLFAQRLPPGSVTCIEHPRLWPRMWGYFNLDNRLKGYKHWLDDGVGQSVDVEGVSLVPLPPEHSNFAYQEERMVEFVYRQMRRPITIVDCGQVTDEPLLLGMADQIVCVLDCDPTFLSVAEFGEKYQALLKNHGDRVITVLNKWTRYARYNDSSGTRLFPGAIKVPYLDPEIMQASLWDGSFVADEQLEEFSALEERIVTPIVPEQQERKPRKLPFFSRRR
ncbi:hypothetical protein ACOALA_20740 (plasmid) [Alicyclobacillus acidoterrestris]|uniref:hypothetical protein n=1 Tax=Alicyclobacillus acidoterrestris TaxID=1450 RepID=UPI003F5354E3